MAGSNAAYRIEDEPLPGPLKQLVVDPVYPLLAFMLGGAWLAWPWYVLNGIAVGSPTRGKELGLAIAGFVGSALGVVTLWSLVDHKILQTRLSFQLALLVVFLWKLLVSYALYSLQARSFALYRYYGGIVRNAFIVVIAIFLLAPRIMQLIPSGALRLVLR